MGYSCRSLGRWSQRHGVAQPFQPVHEPPFHSLAIPLIEVIATQVAVARAVHQHVVSNDQDGVGDGDGRLCPTAASGHAGRDGTLLTHDSRRKIDFQQS
jgi:hypothetical protein